MISGGLSTEGMACAGRSNVISFWCGICQRAFLADELPARCPTCGVDPDKDLPTLMSLRGLFKVDPVDEPVIVE